MQDVLIGYIKVDLWLNLNCLFRTTRCILSPVIALLYYIIIIAYRDVRLCQSNDS